MHAKRCELLLGSVWSLSRVVQVTVDIAEIKEKLPLHLDELQPLLNAVQAKAHIAYNGAVCCV